METQSSVRKPLHPLLWVAGIAFILFSAVGIGAFMGWIPTASSDPAAAPASAVQSANALAPVKAPSRARAAPARHKEPVNIASSTPQPSYARPCAECGVIESVREVSTKGEGSGLGAVGGGVVGGILGHQVGGGSGKDVMTVVGAVGGALAGNEIEKRSKSTVSHAITVRFDDGSSRVFNESAASTWRTGDKVRIVDGVIRSNS